jgi:hypothetical protein
MYVRPQERRRPGLRGLALGLGAASFASVAGLACEGGAGSGNAVHLSIAPGIVAPLSVLADAQTVTVYVFPDTSGATCDATTGLANVSGARLDLMTASEQTDLKTSGCTVAGARYCGDIMLPVDTTLPQIFQVVAYGAGHAELGDGCAQATVSGATVTLPLISMLRFLTPSTCGDGIVGATEQCEPTLATDTSLCDQTCHSVESFLSSGIDSTTDDQTQTTDAQVKSDPFLLWPQASTQSGHLLALFTDYPTGHKQVGVRILSPTMQPATDEGSEATSHFVWLPNDPSGTFPPVEAANSQSQPAGVLVGSTYFVVFADDANTSDGSPDIHLRTMDLSLVAAQPMGSPVGINGAGGAGEAGEQAAPAIAAGPNAQLLVSWVDVFANTAAVRTVDETSQTLGTEHVLGSAAGADAVSIASTGGGWVATWVDNGHVQVQAIGSDGSPKGTVATVSGSTAGTHPRVAALPDGRYAVTWSATGGGNGADVLVQRFSSAGVAVSGDGTAPITDQSSAGDQTSPTIAPLTSDGGSFAVAWVDGPSGQIYARYLGGGGGFLYNNVDGQDHEFPASITDGHTRAQPTVAEGGAGPYVAFGWQDTTTANGAQPGIYARRFPLPP